MEVAQDLLGRTITVRDSGAAKVQALIIETEAYGGADDPASHAAFRPGGRAAQMFREAGSIYVYAAYGMYPCFNIVTDDKGLPGAVLLRGVYLKEAGGNVCGPGRTAKALGVTLADQGMDVCGSRIQISRERLPVHVVQTERIGITRGTAIPWRFVVNRDQANKTR